MRRQPRYNIQPHTWLPPIFMGMNAKMTSQLNVAVIHKLRGSLMCLAYFLTCYPCLYNQALADLWLTGGENKCLYCRWVRYILWCSFSFILLLLLVQPLKQSQVPSSVLLLYMESMLEPLWCYCDSHLRPHIASMLEAEVVEVGRCCVTRYQGGLIITLPRNMPERQTQTNTHHRCHANPM